MGEHSRIGWKTIPIFPDYEVSDHGSVRRRTPGKGTWAGRMLRTPIDAEGYPTVNLEGKPRRVHVLVAATFIKGWTPSCEVHHRNEDRADPRLTNLEVAPSALAHRERHRRKPSGRRRHGEPNPIIACSCGCGVSFPKFDSDGRPRRFVSGHNQTRDYLGRFVRRTGGGEARVGQIVH